MLILLSKMFQNVPTTTFISKNFTEVTLRTSLKRGRGEKRKDERDEKKGDGRVKEG